MNAIRTIDTLRREPTFGSWFHRIVANAALQKVRHQRGRRVDLQLDDVLPPFDTDGCHAAAVVDWSAAVDGPARYTGIRLAVMSASEKLPPHYRAVRIMRDVEDWSWADIAEVFRISVGGVKTRLRRARLFIRKRLAESRSGRSPGPPVRSRD